MDSSANHIPGVCGEREDEEWRLGSTTPGRGIAGSWKMRTGDALDPDQAGKDPAT